MSSESDEYDSSNDSDISDDSFDFGDGALIEERDDAYENNAENDNHEIDVIPADESDISSVCSSSSDAEDELLFDGCKVYETYLKPIKYNEPHVDKLLLHSSSHFLHFSMAQWSRVGHIIKNSEHVLELNALLYLPSSGNLVALLEGLKQNRSLRVLNLGYNYYCQGGANAICSFLEEKQCRLKELKLDAIHMDLKCLSKLGNILKQSNETESLSLCRSLTKGVNWKSGTPLSQMNWTALKVLRLASNDIGIEGCRDLARLLQDPKCHLTKLELNNNFINDECCFVLAQALKNNDRLQTLDISNCSVSDVGLGHFLRALCDMTSVKHTYNSNFGLKKILHGIDLSKSSVANRLEEMLLINLTGSRFSKVYYAHFTRVSFSKVFDIKSSHDLDMKLLSDLHAKLLRLELEQDKALWEISRMKSEIVELRSKKANLPMENSSQERKSGNESVKKRSKKRKELAINEISPVEPGKYTGKSEILNGNNETTESNRKKKKRRRKKKKGELQNAELEMSGGISANQRKTNANLKKEFDSVASKRTDSSAEVVISSCNIECETFQPDVTLSNGIAVPGNVAESKKERKHKKRRNIKKKKKKSKDALPQNTVSH